MSAKTGAPLRPDERTDFYCCRCGKHYIRQKGNFPASQSPLYKGGGGYLDVCNHCVDDIYVYYKDLLKKDIDAMRRVCMKFDIYWSPEIYAMVNKAATNVSRMRNYISKTNLYKYVGKSYDDTIAEDDGIIRSVNQLVTVSDETDVDGSCAENETSAQPVISEDVVNYWGTGFTPSMYEELEQRRKYWMSQFPVGTELDPGEEGLLRQICNLEISINHDRAAGKPIAQSTSALNNLFGSMNIKPSQRADTEGSYIPFGVEIMKFENDEPIPDPDPAFADVDGMRRNVLAWFLGSLCKTAKIKNEYSEFFDDEIAKYTVTKPEYEDADLDDDSDDDQTDPIQEGADDLDG